MSHTEQMREAFERHMSDDGKFPKAVERSGDGYRLLQTQNAWDAWKACAAAIIAKTTTENTPEGMLSTTCPWCESGFAFEAPALTAPAAEVPEAMGDAEIEAIWESTPGTTSWRCTVVQKDFARRVAQWQSTRLRGGVPEVWKRVPVEPTPEMIREVEHAARLGAVWTAESVYKAMLTAAPQAPAVAPAPKAEPVRNNPVSALAIRILVESGRVTQADADSAFTIACEAMEQEAERMNVELPWVSRKTAPAADAGVVREVSQAARDVLAERQRQISAEGWTPEHDDAHHAKGDLAMAASCYASQAFRPERAKREVCPGYWPWEFDWWKPGDTRRDLIKAGALILAEIERLDRAAMSAQAGKGGAA